MGFLTRASEKPRPRSNMEAFAAAAAALLIGIGEDEAGLELVLDIVHLAADQEHDRGRVDEDPHPLVLDHVLELLLILGLDA